MRLQRKQKCVTNDGRSTKLGLRVGSRLASPGIFRHLLTHQIRPYPPSMSTSGSNEPRVSKSRLPRAYTEEQLTFLRNNLNDFERKSQGSIRGDAKKFALEKASEFIARFGIPPDVESGPDVDVEAKFKEVS
jgi:hypothetical protein